MTELHFEVPVVAHRLYGINNIERLSRITPRIPGASSPLPGFSGETDSVLYPTIDRDHGTRVSVEEIRAIFSPDTTVEGSEGFTVNSYWEPMGIRFVLLGIIDDGVDRHFADFLPSHELYYKPVIDPIVQKGRVERSAIHLFCARELEGRIGQASSSSRYRSAWVLLQDKMLLTEESSKRSWSRWITTVAHEFGHVLDLGHISNNGNVMFPYIPPPTPEIRTTQMRIAQNKASTYTLPPGTPSVAPYLGVDENLRIRR